MGSPVSDPPDGFVVDSAPAPAASAPLPEGFEVDHPHTTAGGFAGSVMRGLAPYAAGAGIGAAAGAPFAGVGAIPGAAAGAGAVMLTDLAIGIYDKLANVLGWPQAATPQDATDKVLDFAGVKRPSTGTERVAETMAGGLAGGAGGAAGARAIGEALAPGVGKQVAQSLAAGPIKQTIGGGLGGAAAQGAAESGAPPIVQSAAGMAASMIPGSRAGVEAAIRPAVRDASPALKTAIDAGYVFPPAEIPKLGEKPGMTTAALSGEAGKIKLQQEASTRNQIVTNRLAATDIGLPPNTPLTEPAFEQALQAPAAVRREVESAVPEVTFSKDYRDKVANLGGRGSLLEKAFPRSATNPEIEEVRSELAAYGPGKAADTRAVVMKIADLRKEANTSLKAIGDAQKHRLGLAQREAADILEDELDNSVRNAPAYFADKIAALQKEAAATTKMIRPILGPTSYYPMYLAHLNAEIAKYQTMLADATAKGSALSTLPARNRAARQMFAKIYDVQAATNPSTGDVSARGLARAFNKGMPFTGGLKTIADASNASPKSTQQPSAFGRSEDWSALDFFGAATSVLSGHPTVAAGILARPFVRGRLLSPGYQRGMIGQGDIGGGFSPLPLISQPGAIPPNLQGVVGQP